ncbi:MAG: PDZ domain-containing protein [Acidobacteria bacterium]|nr:PDZ domain-containing protein [Acidobacteriota bacterium]
MPNGLRYTLVSSLLILTFFGLPALPAQTPDEQQSAALILTQVRQATGGDAWSRVAEIHTEGTVLFKGETGTFQDTQDLCSGADVQHIAIPAFHYIRGNATRPHEDWEQDYLGYVQLKPGGKDPSEIDDLYITSNGWWSPHFGGASVSLLQPATDNGKTYDLLQFKVPGGSGFTLWINRRAHQIDRIVSSGSTTYFGDYRKVKDGLVLPFEQKQETPNGVPVLTTTKLTIFHSVRTIDFQPPFLTDYTMPVSGQVTIPAEDGLIFKMKINGQGPFRTVFDTGAENIVSANFAKRLGLKIEEAPVHFQAIGGAITVHTAHVDTLTIGDLTVRDQTFNVLDIPSGSGNPEMLVGWELMRRFAVRLDPEHNQITFFDAPHFHYTGTGTAVPLILSKYGNGAEIHAQVDSIPGIFLLDTGNQKGSFLNFGFVKKHDLVSALHARYKGYNGRGFGGSSPEAWFTRLHTLTVGDSEIRNPLIRLQTKQDGDYTDAGNIGQDILSRFTLTVDCMRGVMYLEKNTGWDKPEIFNRAGLILDPIDGVDNVMTVLPGSPAEVSGIKPGDSITEINGQKPTDDPNDPAFTQPVGTIVELTIRRNNTVRVYHVTLKDML